jgi:hypothetical protein
MPYPKQSKSVHIEKLNNELCLYDWQRKQVHNLNPTAARVWELCDGQTTPQEMAAQLHGDLTPAQAEELVWLTLKRLEQAHLLEHQVVKPSGRKVLTRREMLAGLGVAAVMLPVISTIVAPSPVAAQSPVAACPIVRTANVGLAPGGVVWTYYAFVEGPITDAQITACAPTGITYSWTGAASPAAGNVGFYLSSGGVPSRANAGSFYGAGTGSPQGPVANPNLWTGNRPYNGIEVGVDDPGGWNVLVLTVTLA